MQEKYTKKIEDDDLDDDGIIINDDSEFSMNINEQKLNLNNMKNSQGHTGPHDNFQKRKNSSTQYFKDSKENKVPIQKVHHFKNSTLTISKSSSIHNASSIASNQNAEKTEKMNDGINNNAINNINNPSNNINKVNSKTNSIVSSSNSHISQGHTATNESLDVKKFSSSQDNLYRQLLMLSKRGDKEKFLEILERIYTITREPANLNYQDENGYSALHYSSEEGNFKIVEILIKGNCNFNLKNNAKKTPLHLATFNGYFDISKLLIENGADLNALDAEKNTPLHFVSMKGHIELMRYLLSKNPNTKIKNIYGKTALDVSREETTTALLKEYLATRRKGSKIYENMSSDFTRNSMDNFSQSSQNKNEYHGEGPNGLDNNCSSAIRYANYNNNSKCNNNNNNLNRNNNNNNNNSNNNAKTKFNEQRRSKSPVEASNNPNKNNHLNSLRNSPEIRKIEMNIDKKETNDINISSINNKSLNMGKLSNANHQIFTKKKNQSNTNTIKLSPSTLFDKRNNQVLMKNSIKFKDKNKQKNLLKTHTINNENILDLLTNKTKQSELDKTDLSPNVREKYGYKSNNYNSSSNNKNKINTINLSNSINYSKFKKETIEIKNFSNVNTSYNNNNFIRERKHTINNINKNSNTKISSTNQNKNDNKKKPAKISIHDNDLTISKFINQDDDGSQVMKSDSIKENQNSRDFNNSKEINLKDNETKNQNKMTKNKTLQELNIAKKKDKKLNKIDKSGFHNTTQGVFNKKEGKDNYENIMRLIEHSHNNDHYLNNTDKKQKRTNQQSKIINKNKTSTERRYFSNNNVINKTCLNLPNFNNIIQDTSDINLSTSLNKTEYKIPICQAEDKEEFNGKNYSTKNTSGPSTKGAFSEKNILNTSSTNSKPNQNPYGYSKTDNFYSNLLLNSIEEERISPASFVCLAMLGKGSFGEVYLVQKINTKENFAMKVLRKERVMGQNLLKYAMAERNVLSLSNHPFIVKLNYAFQTSSKLFLILEYCPGGDLAKHLYFEKRFTEERAKFYICEILLALEYLHERNIIFRDLKPDNVVLDDESHAKLTDFGLSKEGVCDGYSAKSFCGSIAYLAPEMLKKQGHGKAVDWYLLGVLFYECLVGVTPFFSSQKENLFRNIEYGELKIPDFISEPARKLLVELLQKDPSKRLGGGPDDANEIKRHPYFKDVNWQDVYDRKLKPPTSKNYTMKTIKLYHHPKLFATDDNSDNPDGFLRKNNLPGWSFILNEEF